jgi:hypothetical protein
MPTGVKSTDLTRSALRSGNTKLRGAPDTRRGVHKNRALDGGSTLRFGRRMRGSEQPAKAPQVVTIAAIIDNSATLFAPGVDAKFIFLGIIDQLAVTIAIEPRFTVSLGLIDNTAVPLAMAIAAAPAVTLTLIDQTAVGIAPSVNPQQVDLDILDQTATVIPPNVTQKFTLALIDQTAVTFDMSITDVIDGVDIIDNTAEVFDIVVTGTSDLVTLTLLDQSATTSGLEPEIQLGQPQTVQLGLLDQEATTLAVHIIVKVKPMIALVGVYDPIIEKAARYNTTINKRGTFVS